MKRLARRPAVLVLSLCAAVAEARSPPRPHWPEGEAVRVWIDAGRAADWQTEMVRRALRTWAEAAQGRVRFSESGTPPAAGLLVGFVADGSNFGEALPLLDRRTGLIVRARVLLLADVPGDALHKRLVLYLTALHEIGHALGLEHSDDFGRIMYRFQRPADPERYFLGYRRRLRSEDDIGRGGAGGLSDADRRALLELYAR